MATADWRANVGTFVTAFAGGQASFGATTQTNVPQAGDYLIGWHVGWQGNFADGAATNGASSAGDPAWVELVRVREPANNHILQVYIGGPLASGGSHETVAFTTIDAGSAGIWAGGVFSIGNLAASPVDVVSGRDDQAPGSPVVTNATGTLAQADEIAIAFNYPVDAVGQAITEDDPPWTLVAEHSAAEPYSVVRQDLSLTSSITSSWALGSGGSGTWNPLSAIITLKVASGGGGGNGGAWSYYAQQQRQRVDRLWKKRGLLWEPSYAMRAA
jgi:hypothetical protein